MSYTKALTEYLTGTTQSALADDAGITQASVSRYVAGERFPERDVAEKIDRATGGKVPLSLWQAEMAARLGLGEAA
jgi:transcriptional regulator with XRE-family HTH domain